MLFLSFWAPFGPREQSLNPVGCILTGQLHLAPRSGQSVVHDPSAVMMPCLPHASRVGPDRTISQTPIHPCPPYPYVLPNPSPYPPAPPVSHPSPRPCPQVVGGRRVDVAGARQPPRRGRARFGPCLAHSGRRLPCAFSALFWPRFGTIGPPQIGK